jgi:hypothetical protein
MTRLQQMDVPVAYPMVQLAEMTEHRLQRYMCFWIAFNNIYRFFAEEERIQGLPKFESNRDGSMKFARQDLGDPTRMRKVRIAGESTQIKHTSSQLDSELKPRLIGHESTAYFVNRIPRLHGEPLHQDVWGQELNGVLNVTRTISREYPVWSPINKVLYRQYLDGDHSEETTNILVRQIVDVLYTVRNNLFHGGKRADDANDDEVVAHALPLLAMIVESFLALDQEADPHLQRQNVTNTGVSGGVRLMAPTIYRGSTHYFVVYSELIHAARYRGLTTYQRIAQLMGLPLSGQHMGSEVGKILGEISEDEIGHGRPMLSAVAVGVSGRPGPGFAALARHLGLLADDGDERAFWELECRRVYEAWTPTYKEQK